MNNCISMSAEECCGCGACVNVCQRHAIYMVEDKFGFFYPKVDEAKCVQCGRCRNACQFIKDKKNYDNNELCYAAISKDNNLLANSSSGGIFSLCAKKILCRSGYIVGAAWDKDFSVHHIIISSIEELKMLQGSKYTQSNMQDCFLQIKQLLSDNKEVLFCGTPCQVEALKTFVGNKEKNLYTIDLVCHGVASNKFLLEDAYQLTKGQKIKEIKFRDKSKGWGTSGVIKTEEKDIPFTEITSPYYYYYYLRGSTFRESCYNCPYPRSERCGDLTCGDYWGIEKEHPDFAKEHDINKGVSCLFINTEKGKQLFSLISDELIFIQSGAKQARKHNGQLSHAYSKSELVEIIRTEYSKRGYIGVYRRWKRKERIGRMILVIKSYIPLKLRIWLKTKIK